MSVKSSSQPFFSGEPFERVIALLIAVVTIIAATAGYLQADAGAKGSRAVRDSQQFALQAMGLKSRGEVLLGYAWSDAYRYWLELDLQAYSADQRGDTAGANRYRVARDQIARLSPLLNAPYFEPTAGQLPDVNAFEASNTLVEATALAERFTNSVNINAGWGAKGGAYVLHLTLLTVALFLYGLSTTIGRMRWLFVGMGTVLANVTVVWMAMTILTPVPSLPEAAITAYARGVGLAFENKPNEAIATFNEALGLAPNYANALYERGNQYFAQGNYTQAATDYEAARSAGRTDANVPWNLGWTYYLLGNFDQSIATTHQALELAPDQIALHFNLGLAQLAQGNISEAQATYKAALDLAINQVSAAQAAGEQPPASLWWYMETAKEDLSSLLNCAYDQICANAPTFESLTVSDAVKTAASDLNLQLREATVSLEYLGRPPDPTPINNTVSALEFSQADYDNTGAIVSYSPLLGQSSALRFGTVAQDEGELGNISVSRAPSALTGQLFLFFDYAAMRDGQLLVVKVYSGGREATGLRLVSEWNLGAQGRASLPLTPGRGFNLSPGDYQVEVYIDGRLLQRGGFNVAVP